MYIFSFKKKWSLDGLICTQISIQFINLTLSFPHAVGRSSRGYFNLHKNMIA